VGYLIKEDIGILSIYILVSSRDLRIKRFNTLTRKIPYRRILKWIIVVGMPRKYVSIVY